MPNDTPASMPKPASPVAALLPTQGDTPPPAAAPDAGAPAAPRFYQRPIPVIILGVIFVLLVVYGARLVIASHETESTDDAFIDGHIVIIAPQVSGRVLAVHVADNQIGEAGAPLFEIDPRDAQSVVEQQRAALAQAQAKLSSDEASAAQAEAHVRTVMLGGESAAATVKSAQATAQKNRQDYDRTQDLQKRGVVSQQDYQHATTDLDTSRAEVQSKQSQAEAALAYVDEAKAAARSSSTQVSASQADVQRSQASLAQAELQLSYTRVMAPVTGRVTRKAIEPGSYVQAGQSTLALVPLEVFVTANFKETQLTEMKPGQPVSLKVDAYPDHAFRGHVDSFQAGSGARFSLLPPENATGNFVKVVQRVPVKIVLDEQAARGEAASIILGPGMSVLPTVTVHRVAAAFLIVLLTALVAAVIAIFFGAKMLASGRPR